MLMRMATSYYSTDAEASSVDVDILNSRIEREVQSNKLAHVLIGIVKELPDVSPKNLTEELVAVKRHAVGLKLASALTAGSGDASAIEGLIQQWQSYVGVADYEATETQEAPITGVSVESLFKTTFNTENLIKVFPKSLNDRLDGGARPGHQLLVFAQTEMGKTLVAINMVAGFLYQKLPVLYVGNEDPAADILLRLGTRLSGLNKYEIRDNPQSAQKRIEERNGGLFTIAPLAPGTFTEVDKLVTTYKPKVVVLDQLRNMNVKSENRTTSLERAATEARNLAKRRGLLVVSLTQAGDSASGKRSLGVGDVDGSNVGIPGQMDAIIGVGADEQMLRQNLRMFSFPKNKLSGNHEPITVQVDPSLSKVLDLAA